MNGTLKSGASQRSHKSRAPSRVGVADPEPPSLNHLPLALKGPLSVPRWLSTGTASDVVGGLGITRSPTANPLSPQPDFQCLTNVRNYSPTSAEAQRCSLIKEGHGGDCRAGRHRCPLEKFVAKSCQGLDWTLCSNLSLGAGTIRTSEQVASHVRDAPIDQRSTMHIPPLTLYCGKT